MGEGYSCVVVNMQVVAFLNGTYNINYLSITVLVCASQEQRPIHGSVAENAFSEQAVLVFVAGCEL